jgi:hypothetical protein
MQFVGEETLAYTEHVFSYIETTLRGQTVLPSLPDGAHNVTVFIGQVLDDGTIRPANVEPFSTTANFNVDSTIQSSPPPQETEPKPFPTTLVATASGTSVAAAIIGLLFYARVRVSLQLQ